MPSSRYMYDDLIWNKQSFPDKITPDEDIILVVREDIIVIILRLIRLFMIAFVLLLLRTVVLGFAGPVTMALYDTLFFSTNCFLLVRGLLYFHDYYLSLQIITTERIIDIDQRGLFNRELNYLNLKNVEDVNYKLSGFWGTIFNYGNVIIQTAGEGSSGGSTSSEDVVNGFTFNNAPNPKAIVNTISKLIHENETKDQHESARAYAQALREELLRAGKKLP